MPVFTADDFGQLAIDGAVIDAGQTQPAVQWTQAYGSACATSPARTTVRVYISNRTVEGNGLNVGNPTCFAAVFYQALVDSARESMVFDNVPPAPESEHRADRRVDRRRQVAGAVVAGVAAGVHRTGCDPDSVDSRPGGRLSARLVDHDTAPSPP